VLRPSNDWQVFQVLLSDATSEGSWPFGALDQAKTDDLGYKEVHAMPMWGGYWGGPWAGFGWIFPLIGLLFMGMMMFMCARMMGGMMHRGSKGSHAAGTADEIADLRREVESLRDEVRRLRERV
jgi:hypothetical protein